MFLGKGFASKTPGSAGWRKKSVLFRTKYSGTAPQYIDPAAVVTNDTATIVIMRHTIRAGKRRNALAIRNDLTSGLWEKLRAMKNPEIEKKTMTQIVPKFGPPKLVAIGSALPLPKLSGKACDQITPVAANMRIRLKLLSCPPATSAR